MPSYYIYIIVLVLIAVLIYYRSRSVYNRKQRELERQMYEKEQERLLENRKEFFANFTHELCSPLTMIMGVSETLSKLVESPAHRELAPYVETLYKNSKQLNQLVQGILDVKYLEDGSFTQLNVQPITVEDIFKRWIYVYEDIARQHNIHLIIDVEQPDLRWNTDLLCMSKIITNIMLIAFKYTPAGGTIRVSERLTTKGELALQVSKSGGGAEKSWKQLFNKVAFTDGAEVSPGVEPASRQELGLIICHEMAEKLDAEIDIESEGNDADRITVTFSRLYESQPADETPAAVTAEKFKQSDDIPEILIIDDNPDILWLVSDILGKDYVITSAANGAEARRAVERQIPSLIITDMVMPDETGIDFIKYIRGNKFTRNLPVIILSAKISEEDKIEGYNAGADAYVTKPFNADFIKTLVARLLQRKTADENYYRSPESAVTLDSGKEISNEGKVFFDSIRKYVSNNLDDENKLTPDAIAQEMGVDIRTLYRRFKKYTPYTPSEFVKKIRYGFAANLILTTDLTIQEIIFQIGMNNKTVFYSDFKKIYGMTPKEYRNSKH